MSEFTHEPVLKQRCLDLLDLGLTPATNDETSASTSAPSRPGFIIDGTLGLGGHSEAILQAFPHINLVGIDRDKKALAHASRRLAPYAPRFHAVHATYDAIKAVARKFTPTLGPLRGVLLDLGVSSMQLDDDERGFSYARDTILDMRMDQTRGRTAAQLLNEADPAELARILREYGEERFAGRIVRHIVARRAQTPLATSGELVDLIRAAIPAPARREGGNPAKRTFQALRVAVNEELTILERTLPRAISALAPGGVIVVEAYQSLEDRLVKHAFKALTEPVSPTATPTHRLLTRGAEKASPAECEANPRAASVRLRALQALPLPPRP